MTKSLYNKNVHIESFHSILEDECIGIYEFETYARGYSEVVEFMVSIFTEKTGKQSRYGGLSRKKKKKWEMKNEFV